MGRGIFITGTDTGVGKTWVSCALIAALRGMGEAARGFKPFETDCPPDGRGGFAPGADARALAAASGIPPSEAAGACLPEPLAPSESARVAGVSLDVDGALADIAARVAAPGWTVVEGAGGLLVPIDDALTYRELIQRAELPAVVVAGNRLGVLNHTLLTVEVLRAAGIPVAAVVLNALTAEPPDGAQATNAAVLRRWLGPSLVIEGGFGGAAADGVGGALAARLLAFDATAIAGDPAGW